MWNTNPLKSHAIKQPAEQCGRHYWQRSLVRCYSAVWAAILYLSLHHCPAGFSNVNNVTAFNIYQRKFILTGNFWCVRGANLLFPNSFAMARVLSLWRSIEQNSLNLRLEGRWVGINTKIHRPFASLELARCVKHQTHARHAYCRGF